MCGAVQMCDYHLEFNLEGVWYTSGGGAFFSEKEAVNAMKKVARESNMPWRVRKDEIVSTYIATANVKKEGGDDGER